MSIVTNLSLVRNFDRFSKSKKLSLEASKNNKFAKNFYLRKTFLNSSKRKSHPRQKKGETL